MAPPSCTNALDDVGDHPGMHEAKLPVRFDELVVALRSVPNQPVCADQAAETGAKYRAGRQIFIFIYQKAGEAPFAFQQAAELIQQFFVGELPAAFVNDALTLANISAETIGSKAVSPRIHMSGGFATRFFFSLKEIRL